MQAAPRRRDDELRWLDGFSRLVVAEKEKEGTESC
jgi:hypothetical protein